MQRHKVRVRRGSGQHQGNSAEQTTTASDGGYSLGENTTGAYDLTSIAPHHAQESEQETVLTPVDTTVDFSPPYVVSGQLDHPFLNSTSASSATLTITEWAPAAGSCVAVSDPRTDESRPATLIAENSDGSSTWSWALQVPQGTAEGDYLLSMWAANCADSTRLTGTSTTPYAVDNTPPIISDPFPTGYYGSPASLVGATVKDDLSGVDVADSDITIDGRSLPKPYSYDTSSGVLSTTASGLVDGAHQVTITAVDGAGNVAVLPYAPTMGEITYQVPSSPTGPCLEQSPLLPGTCEVTVSSSDAAINVGSATWSFVVDSTVPLP